MTPVRASSPRGKKWHAWLARGIAVCGTPVIADVAPFDPSSAHSCQMCARSVKARHSGEREGPNPRLLEIRQKAKEKAAERA